MSESTSFATDLQATAPEVPLALTRAGVTGVQKVIRIAHAGTELVYYADIDCYVDLDPAQKGVHMSRFPETVAEAIDNVVIAKRCTWRTWPSTSPPVVERQQALRRRCPSGPSSRSPG
jgi:GTP cyclohydrolase I/GTP cyclohydrolase-4